MKVVTIILTCLVALLLLAVPAAGDSGACTFSGRVYGDVARVGDGTLVTAVVAGDEYYAQVSTGDRYPTYSLTIQPPEGKNYADGTEVSFRVNGHVTDQTAPFIAGENFRLDLAASAAPTPTLLPSYIAIIAVSILALVTAGALAYYFLPHRRGLRITGLVTREARIEQPATSSVSYRVRSPAHTKVAPQPKQDSSLLADNHRNVATETQAAAITGRASKLARNTTWLYAGIIDLWVESPSGIGQLKRFSNHLGRLKRTHQIRVIDTKLLSSQSICFELFVRRPTLLVDMLESLPEVDTVSDALKGKLLLPGTGSMTQIQVDGNISRIEVKLRAA